MKATELLQRYLKIYISDNWLDIIIYDSTVTALQVEYGLDNKIIQSSHLQQFTEAIQRAFERLYNFFNMHEYDHSNRFYFSDEYISIRYNFLIIISISILLNSPRDIDNISLTIKLTDPLILLRVIEKKLLYKHPVDSTLINKVTLEPLTCVRLCDLLNTHKLIDTTELLNISNTTLSLSYLITELTQPFMIGCFPDVVELLCIWNNQSTKPEEIYEYHLYRYQENISKLVYALIGPFSLTDNNLFHKPVEVLYYFDNALNNYADIISHILSEQNEK